MVCFEVAVCRSHSKSYHGCFVVSFDITQRSSHKFFFNFFFVFVSLGFDINKQARDGSSRLVTSSSSLSSFYNTHAHIYTYMSRMLTRTQIDRQAYRRMETKRLLYMRHAWALRFLSRRRNRCQVSHTHLFVVIFRASTF